VNNNTFKKTERTLYNYKNINLDLENIDLCITQLENDVSYAGVSFEQRSSPTNAFSSSVENEVIQREEYLTDKIRRLKKLKFDTLSLKQRINNALEKLTNEEYKLVELRYFSKEKKSWVEIGMTLGIDYMTCHRMKNRIINILNNSIYPYE
jgi:RinA family phage transcriptional activator